MDTEEERDINRALAFNQIEKYEQERKKALNGLLFFVYNNRRSQPIEEDLNLDVLLDLDELDILFLKALINGEWSEFDEYVGQFR